MRGEELADPRQNAHPDHSDPRNEPIFVPQPPDCSRSQESGGNLWIRGRLPIGGFGGVI